MLPLLKNLPFCDELCHELPKVDLHRHLTGSLPTDMLRNILEGKNPELAQDALLITPDVLDKSPEAHKAAWDLLVKQCNAVHLATSTRPTGNLTNLRNLFNAAISALRKDNIMYCEFRIGLKDEPTKREYLNTLIDIIREQEAVHQFPVVSLLLSVARHGDIKVGDQTMEIAAEYAKETSQSGRPIVCGVELGGVVTAGDWTRNFEPVFAKARAAGIRIALHCGEDLTKQSEWRAMIEFKPDRLGHCVYLDEDNLKRVQELKIPVEACLTCHKRVFDTPMSHNIFGKLFPSSPVTLATDNPSFYAVTLSQEYAHCCRHFDLTFPQLVALARQGLEYSFISAARKRELLVWFDQRIAQIKKKYGIDSSKI